MAEHRIRIWFRLLGLFTLLSGPYFYFLIRSVYHPQLINFSKILNKGLLMLTVVFSLSLIFCGLMVWIFSEKASEGDKLAQGGIRLVSLFVFLLMCGIFLMGKRDMVAYLLVLFVAINLVGLCPFCNKRRSPLFNTEFRRVEADDPS